MKNKSRSSFAKFYNTKLHIFFNFARKSLLYQLVYHTVKSHGYPGIYTGIYTEGEGEGGAGHGVRMHGVSSRRLCLHACAYVRACACLPACACVHARASVHTCACVRVRACVCVRACVHACVSVCVCVCVGGGGSMHGEFTARTIF